MILMVLTLIGNRFTRTKEVSNMTTEGANRLVRENLMNIFLALKNTGDCREYGKVGFFVFGRNNHQKDDPCILMFTGICKIKTILTAPNGENIGLINRTSDVRKGNSIA